MSIYILIGFFSMIAFNNWLTLLIDKNLVGRVLVAMN
jgi:hypothetical protein